MLKHANAHLLRDSIGSLLDSPYFSRSTLAYARTLHKACTVLIERWHKVTEVMREEIVNVLWKTYKYIAGSTSNDIPFEIEHCLQLAIKQWKPTDKFLISTALMQEKDFHFLDCDPWEVIKKHFPDVTLPDHTLVQIALPKLYKHSPLLCAPLFHELGHFIDTRDAVTRASFLADKKRLTEAKNEADKDISLQLELRYRAEHFADLFMVSYIGVAAIGFLDEFALGDEAVESHPSTVARSKVMKDFLAQRSNPLISTFNRALVARGLPKLRRKFSAIDVRTPFLDFRPCKIQSGAQLFGTFNAAWHVLMESSKPRSSIWKGKEAIDRVRLANDLTEKSIRNYFIQEMWREPAAQG